MSCRMVRFAYAETYGAIAHDCPLDIMCDRCWNLACPPPCTDAMPSLLDLR